MASQTDKMTRSGWVIVGLVSLGVIFTALDQTVVVTVLPEMMVDLEIGVTELDHASWIVTGYLLGYTVAIPLVARMADVYGHSLVLRVSLLVFAVGSAMVALSPNLPLLVGSRVIQALGGGAIIPIGMAVAAHYLPDRRKAIAVGIVGAAAEIGIVLGPLYGGGITAALGWRWLFWLDIPQAVIILVAIGLIPNRGTPGAKVDYMGGLLLAGALVLLVIALSQRGLFTGTAPLAYLLGASGMLLVVVFVMSQMKRKQPLMDPRFFASVEALSAVGAKLLVGAALVIALVTVPLMADTIHGQSAFGGGLRLMRLTGAIPIAALLGGYLTYRIGPRSVAVVGMALAALGLWWMSGWGVEVTEAQLSLHLALAGAGFGLVIAPLFVTAMETGGQEYQATAASMVTVARMIGMALGLAALAAWGMEQFQTLTIGLEVPLRMAGETSQELQLRIDEYSNHLNNAGVSLFQNFYRVAATLMLMGIVPSLWLARKEPTGEGTGDPQETPLPYQSKRSEA